MKHLTLENWNVTDEMISSLVTTAPEGDRPMTADDVARAVLSIDLHARTHIPEGPKDLLLSAQATMVYGALYYPLLAVGLQLCGRAGEAAIRECARQAGVEVTYTNSKGEQVERNFATLIDLLRKQEYLSEERAKWWHVARVMRNAASHPEQQEIYSLTMACITLDAFASRIDELFQE